MNKSTDSGFVSFFFFFLFFQARNIRNKPIVNRDPQNTRLAEMQNEIQVINLNLTQYLDFSVVGETGAFCLACSTGSSVPGSSPDRGRCVVFLGKTRTLTVPLFS